MNRQLGFLFQPDRCFGCKACEIACRNENKSETPLSWRRVKKTSAGQYLSISCNHCDSPECFRVCPEKAFTKNKDGIVTINSDLCNGCRLCVSACPYGATQFDAHTHKVSKCQLCHHRLNKNLQTACVEACSTNALQLIDLNNFHDLDAIKTVDDFPDIRLTNPSILFYPTKNKKRYWIE